MKKTVLYRTGPQRKLLYGLLAAGGLVALLLMWHAWRADPDIRIMELVVLGMLLILLCLISGWWRRAGVVVTEDTLVIEPGFPGSSTLEVPLRLVSRVEVVNTRIGDAMGFATVIFRFRGEPGSATIPLLPDPDGLTKAIRQHREVVNAVLEDEPRES